MGTDPGIPATALALIAYNAVDETTGWFLVAVTSSDSTVAERYRNNLREYIDTRAFLAPSAGVPADG